MSTPTGTPKRVAKVTIEAPVVSFRYPHFLIGQQPSFDVPPPSTIFGHVASALGEWPTEPLHFAYAFTAHGRGSDLEHQHIISRAPGKLPEPIVDPLWKPEEPPPGKKLTKKQLAALNTPRLLERTTEGTVQPHKRDFLFDVRLELYLDPPELAEAFRSPVFTVVLGRSQDLACVRRVEVVDLLPATQGYLERTIIPGSMRPRLPWGMTTLMPRYIGPAPERQPVFESYIVLRERVYVGYPERTQARQLLTFAGAEDTWWTDPATTEDRGGKRLLYFHTLEGGAS
ncbi:CRISPR-associated protein Cas5 [bacterium]|nr:CRISPR-associated protein Cas5 [bacterium]